MPVPTAYTEQELAQYMADTLGAVAQSLGYDPNASYAEAVNETLLQYGVEDIALATDVRKLRALARVQAWQKVLWDVAGDYDFSADGARFDRSQVHAMALANYQRAVVDALPYDVEMVAVRRGVRPLHDPYTYLPTEDRPR